MVYDMKTRRLNKENSRTSSTCWIIQSVLFEPLLLDPQTEKNTVEKSQNISVGLKRLYKQSVYCFVFVSKGLFQLF